MLKSYFQNRRILIILSAVALLSGYFTMSLDSKEYGFGFAGLTLGPVLILFAFILIYLGIFYGSLRKIRDKISLIGGWSVFFISLMVYMYSLEPTASLWDCSEFIACAYKLQVPHAPGVPLYLLLGRMFSLLALGDTAKVAFYINLLSAVASAGAVMFTYWSVVIVVRNIGESINSIYPKQIIHITAFVGSLILAFSDSFWFSAVEAETYALAIFFIALNTWAILKWYVSDDSLADKWLLFISFNMGLAVGAHPMCLLVLPAIGVLLLLKKKKRYSVKNVITGIVAGLGLLILGNHLLLTGIPELLKWADIFTVNIVGLPFNSGVAIMAMVLVVIFIKGLQFVDKKKKRGLRILIIGMMLFVTGASTYTTVVIRSGFNPPIDENNPENIVSLVSYLKRESYPTRPLVYGPNFDARNKGYNEGAPVYEPSGNEYVITDRRSSPEYRRSDMTLFPRLYSNDPQHVAVYKEWTGLKAGESPTLYHNLRFMLTYQLGHMYFRYLMWNFAGREGDQLHAGWLGITDVFHATPDFLKQNKAYNMYFMLPLLLGLAGWYFLYKKDRKIFWFLMALFLFLGPILVIYLNATPNEPRERDYIYVGSFLAFCISTGVGVQAIIYWISGFIKRETVIFLVGGIFVLIPVLVFSEGFNDHNRHNRFLHIDYARNVLNSCAPNAVLFTGGDNDTFPLWYLQEVEGIRTDVRVIVLTYFNAGWFIEQMTRKVYLSEPLPFSLKKQQFRDGGFNDILPYIKDSNINNPINVTKWLDMIRNEHPALRTGDYYSKQYNFIPSGKLYLNVDKQKILGSGLVPGPIRPFITDRMEFTLKENYLLKNSLMILDLLVHNHWERPIYLNQTSLHSLGIDISDHVVNEGFLYRVLPVNTPEKQQLANVDCMYSNLMENSSYHHIAKKYYNTEDFQLRIIRPLRMSYNQLAGDLINRGEMEKALEVARFLVDNFYTQGTIPDISTIDTVDVLFEVGENKKAASLLEDIYVYTREKLFLERKKLQSSKEVQLNLYILRLILQRGNKYKLEEIAEKCREDMKELVG